MARGGLEPPTPRLSGVGRPTRFAMRNLAQGAVFIGVSHCPRATVAGGATGEIPGDTRRCPWVWADERRPSAQTNTIPDFPQCRSQAHQLACRGTSHRCVAATSSGERARPRARYRLPWARLRAAHIRTVTVRRFSARRAQEAFSRPGHISAGLALPPLRGRIDSTVPLPCACERACRRP